MLHNTRKMVFHYLKKKKKQKARKKHSSKRGDQGGRIVDGGGGEKKIAFAWLLCKATCEQYYIMPIGTASREAGGKDIWDTNGF